MPRRPIQVNREPPVNLITVHDGFTLRDLVSYDGKHNEANGRDRPEGAGQLNRARDSGGRRAWHARTAGESPLDVS